MKCSKIPELSYRALSEELHRLATEGRIPISGGLEITYRCNMNCVHCYVRGLRPDNKELSLEETRKILDALAEEGCLWLLLTGGEPLLRPDFADIYLHAKRKGFIVTVFTNGTLLTEEVIEVLTEYPPFNVEITLYGMTEDVYESVTRTPGSFAKCMAGIKRLAEAKIPLQLKSIILSSNKHEIPLMKDFCNSLGMPFMFDPVLSPCLDQSQAPREYSLTPQEIVDLDVADKERLKEWLEYYESNCQKPKSNDLYRCSAGQTSFMINPHGKLQFCILARIPSYDLRNGNFRDGWNGILAEARKQKSRSGFKCDSCDLHAICGQCPGWSYLDHGNPDTPVDYLCNIAHERARTFQRERR